MRSQKNQVDKNEGASQIDRFKEVARQLGCDEDEAHFDEKLKEIAKHKPKEKTDKGPDDAG